LDGEPTWLRVVAGASDIEEQHTVAAKTAVEGMELAQRADEQGSTNNQNHRYRKLRDHETLAEAAVSGPALFQHGIQVGAHGVKRRREAGEQAGDHRYRAGKREHAPVRRDGELERDTIAQHSDERGAQCAREQQSGSTA
jgi:hypothetical protein